jgi:hypothetical protein
MKIKVFLFFMFCNFLVFSQEVESVKIQKSQYKLYKGVLKETQFWYLFEDFDGVLYLANIDPSIENIDSWFNRFKNSQNIYRTIQIDSNRSEIGGSFYRTLTFQKLNDPENSLSFYIEKPEKDNIVLISLKDNSIFSFVLIEN